MFLFILTTFWQANGTEQNITYMRHAKSRIYYIAVPFKTIDLTFH